MMTTTLYKHVTITDKQLAKLRRMAERPLVAWAVKEKQYTQLFGRTTRDIGMEDTHIFAEWGLIELSRVSYHWQITDKGRALFTDLKAPPPLPTEPPSWVRGTQVQKATTP